MTLTKELLDYLADDKQITKETYEQMCLVLNNYHMEHAKGFGDVSYAIEYLQSKELKDGLLVAEFYDCYVANCNVFKKCPCNKIVFGKILHKKFNFASRPATRYGKSVRVLYKQLTK